MSTRIQLRRGISTEWFNTNPVLTEGEPGVETDTGFIKIGDGVKNYNSLPYASTALGSSVAGLQIITTGEPIAPPDGVLQLYAKNVGGRSMLTQKNHNGLDMILQPHIGSNIIQLVTCNTGSTTPAVLNCSVGTSGSAGYIPPSVSNSGCISYATPATANQSSYIQTGSNCFMRGDEGKPGGFHFRSRFFLPDASYNTTGAGIGSYLAIGMSSTTNLAIAGDDNITSGANALFKRVSTPTLHESNWYFHTGDNTLVGQTKVDTGLPFSANSSYYIEIYIAPGSDTIYWSIINESTGGKASGSTSTTLPPMYTLMKPVLAIKTLNAVVRKIALCSFYVESDR
jgi:hypothetical protein